MHELAHEFTSRKVSPWGGIKYFHQTYLKSGMREDLLSAGLPEGGSNAAYSAIDLAEGFMVSVVLGARRFVHSGMLRTDEVIREIFGWRRGMASQSTFSRFFGKFDLDSNDRIFTEVMRKWWEKMAIEKMTIDIDSTVITRFGNQEGAKKGYNPQKHGRQSHHPLLAFCDELKMVVHAWMREGNVHTAANTDCFVDQLLEIVPKEKIGLIRGDSGFYDKEILGHLEREDKAVNYIIRAKMTGRLMEVIRSQQKWYANDSVVKGAFYTEFDYQATGWYKSRRMVVVAKPKEESKNRKNKQEVLFANTVDTDRYEFVAYVTSTDLSASLVHSTYNQRADCENRIKELKYDFGMDGFAMQSFAGMEAAFRFVMLAYNLMALFKQKVMAGPVRNHLSTIRFQCIAIGSYLVRDGRKKKMKLSAEGKRRHFLEHIFEKTERLEPPFQFSTA